MVAWLGGAAILLGGARELSRGGGGLAVTPSSSSLGGSQPVFDVPSVCPRMSKQGSVHPEHLGAPASIHDARPRERQGSPHTHATRPVGWSDDADPRGASASAHQTSPKGGPVCTTPLDGNVAAMAQSFALLILALAFYGCRKAEALSQLPHHARGGEAAKLAGAPVYRDSAEERSITLPLDHFNDSGKTFDLRYFVDDTFFKSKGPIFFIMGGEVSGSQRACSENERARARLRRGNT